MNHGGDLSEAIALYGGAVHDWLDLSTGINPEPWPVPPDLLAGLHHLPTQADENKLISVASTAFDVPAHCLVVAAPGAQSLIQWLPHLAPPGAVAVLSPTYSEHARSWQQAGRDVSLFEDLTALPSAARHLVLVNPNNPDGRSVRLEDLRRTAETILARHGWLIIDESFIDCAPHLSAISLCQPLPVLSLRSFGKFHGLPGLRLGFLIAHAEIARLFRQALGPWPVSTPALRIGAAALADQAWAMATHDKLALMAVRLDEVLEAAGLHVIGGASLFRLVSCETATALHEALARKHIWCRCFNDAPNRLRFGLPRNDEELERLREGLRLS
jgi:cobalamin biosynthetic protein CobC